MGDPEIWVIVPFSRPHCFERLVENFSRQTHAKKRLLVVCAEKVDRQTRAMLSEVADVSLRDVGGPQGEARNIGMAQLLREESALVSFWDDDDHYGPFYLEEQAAAVSPGTIVGKGFGFTLFDEGMVYFEGPRNCETKALLIGGTIAGFVHDMPSWTKAMIGEDGAFSSDCRQLGLTTRLLSGRHWVYDRTGALEDHTFRAPPAKIWTVAGGRAVPCSMSVDEALGAEEPTGEAVRFQGWRRHLQMKS